MQQTAETIIQKLRKPFNENELEWRPQSQGINGDNPWILVIPYVQARAIQNRLDDVFGFGGWQVEYRDKTTNIICRISAKVDGEWIYKEDGASETHIEAFKGGISSALKRCASSGFGIGRYLYDLKPVYAECTLAKRADWNKSKVKIKENGKDKDIVIYWKTPKIAKCEPISEPLTYQINELDADLDILLGVEACDTHNELAKYYKQHCTKVQNKEALIAKCAERKAEFNANN